MKKNIKKWLFIDLTVLFVGVGYYLATYFLGQTRKGKEFSKGFANFIINE